MLGAAGAVLVGGTILARRDVTERVAVDRTLVREFAMEFSGELRRLEAVYLDDLQQLAETASTENQSSLKEACASLHGVRQYSLFEKKSDRPAKNIKIEPFTGEPIPELTVRSAKDRTPFGNQIPLARELLFPPATHETESGEGWITPRDGRFVVFWSRLNENDNQSVGKGTAGNRKRKPTDAVLAFLLDMREIGNIACNYLKPTISILYAPVRAEGGLNRLEGPGGVWLAGLEQPPQREPDFIVPLPSRIGNWQILAWDTFRPHVVYHQPTLFVTGTLTAVLVAAGLILFIQQRRAQRLAEQRVSFVNRVSHELGTPLTNILLNLELSLETFADRPQEARRRLDFVTEETRRLARLVRNVLAFSRKERGKLKINPVPCVPDEVITGVLNQFSPALTRAGIEVERHGSAAETIACDVDALAQIIANLVSNVEKYAANGKRMGVESQLIEEFLIVRVSDRGPGIPAEARERIFHPFERVADSVHDGITGTGLGLAIARDLAELMGGTLKLVAADNGAVFELRLPAPKEKEV